MPAAALAWCANMAQGGKMKKRGLVRRPQCVSNLAPVCAQSREERHLLGRYRQGSDPVHQMNSRQRSAAARSCDHRAILMGLHAPALKPSERRAKSSHNLPSFTPFPTPTVSPLFVPPVQLRVSTVIFLVKVDPDPRCQGRPLICLPLVREHSFCGLLSTKIPLQLNLAGGRPSGTGVPDGKVLKLGSFW